MAITKILNIQESEGRNPASHLKNALEYIQNPDKTEECVLVGGINCLADTVLSVKLDAPAPCRLDAPDLDLIYYASADCLHQHLQVI